MSQLRLDTVTSEYLEEHFGSRTYAVVVGLVAVDYAAIGIEQDRSRQDSITAVTVTQAYRHPVLLQQSEAARGAAIRIDPELYGDVERIRDPAGEVGRLRTDEYESYATVVEFAIAAGRR